MLGEDLRDSPRPRAINQALPAAAGLHVMITAHDKYYYQAVCKSGRCRAAASRCCPSLKNSAQHALREWRKSFHTDLLVDDTYVKLCLSRGGEGGGCPELGICI